MDVSQQKRELEQMMKDFENQIRIADDRFLAKSIEIKEKYNFAKRLAKQTHEQKLEQEKKDAELARQIRKEELKQRKKNASHDRYLKERELDALLEMERKDREFARELQAKEQRRRMEQEERDAEIARQLGTNSVQPRVSIGNFVIDGKLVTGHNSGVSAGNTTNNCGIWALTKGVAFLNDWNLPVNKLESLVESAKLHVAKQRHSVALPVRSGDFNEEQLAAIKNCYPGKDDQLDAHGIETAADFLGVSRQFHFIVYDSLRRFSTHKFGNPNNRKLYIINTGGHWIWGI